MKQGNSSDRVRIALDAMGGDFAPQALVEGALLAVRELPVEVTLVGDEKQVGEILAGAGPTPKGITIHHAPDVIAMGAHPIEAIKKQKESSIVIAAKLVKEGGAEALVSAGSTGAAMASSLLQWGRIKGVERPAIGTLLPSLNGAVLLLDAGAQVDCRPSHLVQFAIMGSTYMQRLFGLEQPRVGLLNIGEEETKGCDLVQETYPRLTQTPGLHFIGNVEGRDILSGKADVVVCDGFVGNVVLKFAEGMGAIFIEQLKEAVMQNRRSQVGGWLLKPGLLALRKRMDYTEYGGAPLLGVRGVSIISHGSSNSKAIYNAIRVAGECVRNKIVDAIESRVV